MHVVIRMTNAGLGGIGAFRAHVMVSFSQYLLIFSRCSWILVSFTMCKQQKYLHFTSSAFMRLSSPCIALVLSGNSPNQTKWSPYVQMKWQFLWCLTHSSDLVSAMSEYPNHFEFALPLKYRKCDYVIGKSERIEFQESFQIQFLKSILHTLRNCKTKK